MKIVIVKHSFKHLFVGGTRKSTLVSDVDLTCPCDLKENSCDTGCCCDEDCTDFENETSTCVPGFFGGATSEKLFEFSCQASWPDSRDWQPFLCVTINNSPVIGYFYNLTSPPLAQDATSFNTLADKKKREVFAFIESEERQTNKQNVQILVNPIVSNKVSNSSKYFK